MTQTLRFRTTRNWAGNYTVRELVSGRAVTVVNLVNYEPGERESYWTAIDDSFNPGWDSSVSRTKAEAVDEAKRYLAGTQS